MDALKFSRFLKLLAETKAQAAEAPAVGTDGEIAAFDDRG